MQIVCILIHCFIALTAVWQKRQYAFILKGSSLFALFIALFVLIGVTLVFGLILLIKDQE